MNKQNEEEKKYLFKLIEDEFSEENPFEMNLYLDNKKFSFNVIKGENKEILYDEGLIEGFSRITDYESIYTTITDLRYKIRYSIKKAIEYSYKEDIIEGYNCASSCEYILAYYYVENAIFRIWVLWDILAHLCNLRYNLNVEIKDIHHGRIFSSQESTLKKYWKNDPPKTIQNIIEYLKEEDILPGKFKGSYKYIREVRNKMTHRLSIGVTSLSSYELSFGEPLHYILRHLCECYFNLIGFIIDICNEIKAQSYRGDVSKCQN